MKRRIFSGAQPTGRLHIGNYLGALKNWVRLQDDYDCVFGIVDYHAITVPFSPQEIKKRVFNCAVGFLASGIDPEKSIIMLQSLVPQHTELTWIFNCISPVQDLMRVPTFKEKASQQKGNVSAGLLDYPVLMAVDILIYKAEFVPVGDDQIPHIELTREIAREFNKKFGKTFPEPKEIVGPRVLGLDGKNKMSKTLDNCIYLDESPDEIWKKLAPAVTDTKRKRRQDPGEPNDCNIFNSYHKEFSSKEELTYIEEGCRNASIGCLDCKRILFDNTVRELAPVKERIESLKDKKDYVMDVIIEGSKKARILAEETLREVKQKMGFDYPYSGET
jgi:tryptophanyl-tRNA synthetase